jgi:putative protease
MNNPLKILIKIDPKDIAFLNKIFEGYDGLAVVSTLDRQKGLVALTVTPDTKEDVLEILKNFPKSIIFN